MKTRFLIAAVSLAAVLPLLAGCYESRDVTLHDAGVYKGKTDPLVEMSADPAYQERLRERLLMVQTDR
ncbi:hypothetical protein [Thioalkalivibrio paradoxus]|uniref:Uncharacterized protein n=1 Tax=Thioalkalivibrio paradoxus ARh 1 TaxID=713585 RepID=W0DFX8_9GAMM|nr:hypothetical protein [Thioalkalivibrio paradoxus]AHE97256.1 hypothetical protein THITH_02100 [Thioalkalivibrio paradoxus ARh 1]